MGTPAETPAALLGLRHVEGEGKNSVPETPREIGNGGQFASGSGDLIAASQSGFSPNAAEGRAKHR